jgi:ribosomal protein S18 acetylase RimI-like enzyme
MKSMVFGAVFIKQRRGVCRFCTVPQYVGSLDSRSDEKLAPKTHFIVKRGHEVVGMATYSEDTGQLTDDAIRPSAAATAATAGGGADEGLHCAKTLLRAVKEHAQKMGRSGSLIVRPRSEESLALFARMGFTELEGTEDDNNDDDEGGGGGAPAAAPPPDADDPSGKILTSKL